MPCSLLKPNSTTALPFSSVHDSGGFCGNHRLQVNGVEQESLNELSFDYGRGHSDKRFAWKRHGAFGHSPDVARELEVAEVVEESAVEALFLEVGEVCSR